MKKQYSVPTLTTHGNVEAITQFFGQTDKNDFLFFSGGGTVNNPPSSTNPATGDGSIDGILTPNGPVPGTTLQGK